MVSYEAEVPLRGPLQVLAPGGAADRRPARFARQACRLRLRRSPARALTRPRPRLQNSKLAFLWFTYELRAVTGIPPPEQLLALAAAVQVCRQGVSAVQPSRPR